MGLVGRVDGDDDAVAAGTFCGEERVVGHGDDFVEGVGVDRGGKTEADREGRHPAGGESERESFTYAFEHGGGRLGAAVGQDDDELFAAVAGRDVIRSNGVAQTRENSRNAWSPASWPCVSFSTLKWSRSP